MSEKIILFRVTIFFVLCTGLCSVIAIQLLLPGKRAMLASIFMYAKSDFTPAGWRFRQAAAIFGSIAFVNMLISFARQ